MAKTAYLEEFVFPEGGIGDFYMEDDEIEALGRLEAEEEFGSSGIANFSEVAERMASYGRHGDDTVAHVETGELIIPKALIEENPKLRDSIFEHLEELGVEDPERYVVGSGSNSINPETGLPEFFFKSVARALKKTVKGVSRAVKKVAKKVVKVVKKVAPIVLPIALAMTPLGPIYGAALGSGIGTLVQGGDLKDAFKSALIAGGTGALFSGASSKLSGGTFTEGVTKAAANPAGRVAQTVSGAKSTFTGQGLTGEGNLFSSYTPTPSEQIAEATADPAFRNQLADAGETVIDGQLTPQEEILKSLNEGTGLDAGVGQSDAGQFLINQAKGKTDAVIQPYQPREIGSTVKDMFTDVGAGDKSFLEAGKDLFFPAGPSPEQLELAKQTAYNNTYNSVAALPGATTEQAAAAGLKAMEEVTAASLSPGFVSSYLPLAAAGTGIAAAGGFFSAPEQEDLSMEDVYTPISTGPQYELGDETPMTATGPTVVDTRYGFDPRVSVPFNPFQRPVRTQMVAEGGEIFPRRVGGIMPDEGTPGEDSVRAMLMPGEFVMTTDAVKGLGNGDNEQGIRNMYDMMRGLEAKGRAMA